MTRHATQTELTLSQAAKATGKSKSTINRAIKSGRLSATRHENGSYSIAASELHRVFPYDAPKGSEWSDAQPEEHPKEPQIELAELRIQALEAALQREREVNEDLRADRDQWRQQAKALIASPAKKRWWPF